MPFANYKFPEGILDNARKEEIIHRTTEMFVEYFGEGVRPYTMVLDPIPVTPIKELARPWSALRPGLLARSWVT